MLIICRLTSLLLTCSFREFIQTKCAHSKSDFLDSSRSHPHVRKKIFLDICSQNCDTLYHQCDIKEENERQGSPCNSLAIFRAFCMYLVMSYRNSIMAPSVILNTLVISLLNSRRAEMCMNACMYTHFANPNSGWDLPNRLSKCWRLSYRLLW